MWRIESLRSFFQLNLKPTLLFDSYGAEGKALYPFFYQGVAPPEPVFQTQSFFTLEDSSDF